MNSFDLYKHAINQWNKAMNYHNNIDYGSKRKGNVEKTLKERKIQKVEYEKAIFYYKLYEYVAKLEERELKK